MLGAAASSGRINLGFRMYLIDNFSGPAAGVKKTMDGLKDEMGMHTANLSALRNVTAAAGAAALMLSRGIFEAAMEGSHFLHTMQGVLAISEATTQQFAELKSLAVSLGRETIFTPDQVASGMRFMAMAGQTATQIQATAKDSTYLAAATLTQLGGKMGAADILTNALKAFGLSVEQSTDMSDMLTYATTSANVQLTDLGNSIRYVAATSRNLNIPVQETVGLLMSLGNAGIQSSMAGTALENMFRYLAMSVSEFATKRQQKTWQNIGLGRKDVMTAEGQFLPMLEVLRKIRDATTGMGAVDLQNVMKEIFGVRGQRAAATLLRNVDQAQGFVDKLHSEGIRGTAAEKSALMMETLQGASLKLTSALDGLKAAFAEALGGVFLNKLLRGLAELVGYLEGIVKTPLGKWIFSIGTLLVTFTGFVLAAKAAVWSLALAINGLNMSFASMRAAGAWGTGAAISTLTGRANKFYAVQAARRVSSVNPVAPVKPSFTSPVGHTYFTASSGRFAKRPPGYLPAGSLAKHVKPAGFQKAGGMLKMLTRITPMLGMLSSVFRTLLGFLMGPWGMALMIAMPFIPMLYRGIRDLIGATNRNTEALKPKDEFKAQMPEIYSMIKDRTMQETFSSIQRSLQHLVDTGQITHIEAMEMASDGNRIMDLMRLAVTEGNIYMFPAGTKPPSENQFNYKGQ